MTNAADQLTTLIKQRKDVIPFLKTLSAEERKTLIPTIRDLRQEYHKRYEKKRQHINGSYYHQLGDYVYPQKHRDLLLQAAVICARNKTEFDSITSWQGTRSLYAPLVVEHILPWYVPKWFDGILNGGMNWHNMPYFRMLELQEMGYYAPTQERILQALVNCLVDFRFIGKNQEVDYRYNDLLRYPVTLQTHFWWLFDQPTDIHNRYSASIPEVFGEKTAWEYTMVRLVEEGQVDRQAVLQACLLTTTKNFNQALGRWFLKVFASLTPTDEELMQLQKELFVCLQSEQSKPVTDALSYIKRIYAQAGFDRPGFLGNVHQLLQATTKSTLRSTLTLLERLAREDISLRPEICLLATEALNSQDEAIQRKAAKLIAKFAEVEDMVVREQLSMFAPLLLHDAKEILNPWLDEELAIEQLEEAYPLPMPDPLDPEEQLSNYTTFDEQVFFISQCLDNHSPEHAEQMIAVLAQLNQKITAENVSKLMPVFRRALKQIWSYSPWGVDITDTLACYLNDYADYLIRKFPRCLPDRAKLIAKEKKERHFAWRPYQRLEQKNNNQLAYDFVDRFYLQAQELLFRDSPLVLLSLPTHRPCWLDPQVLIERLNEWIAVAEPIRLYDWQMAILRLPQGKQFSNIETTLASVKDVKLRHILAYALGVAALPNISKDRLGFLLPAVIARRDSTALQQLEKEHGVNLSHLYKDYLWKHQVKTYQRKHYNYKTRKRELVTYQEKELSLPGLDKYEKSAKTFLGKARTRLVDWGILSLVDYGMLDKFVFTHWGTYYWHNFQDRDAARFLMSCPNHWALYFAGLVKCALRKSELPGEREKRLLERTLDFLRQAWHRSDEHEVTYLFVAASMLCNHKTARQLAAEFWLHTIQYNTIDTERLGTIMGKLLGHKYAPLKRFTDLLTEQLVGISPWFDQQLFLLLDNMLPHMPVKPMTNTKKLLEVYTELVLKYPCVPSEGSRQKLKQWAENKTLKRWVKRIS